MLNFGIGGLLPPAPPGSVLRRRAVACGQGAGGPVRAYGPIPPTSLRLWAPPVHAATGGYAVRRLLPLRPCLSGSYALRVLRLFLASQKPGRKERSLL